MNASLKQFYNSNIEYWEKYTREYVRSKYLEMLNLEDCSLEYCNHDIRILDMGCGCGHDAAKISKLLSSHKGRFDGVGVDFCEEAIKFAKLKQIDNWTFCNIDFKDLLLCEGEKALFGKFDIVICSMVIMHYSKLDEIFGIIKSLLNKNGKALIVTNNPYLISLEYNISYKDQLYEHIFEADGKKLCVDKYFHTISDYFESAIRADLKLKAYREISSYSGETNLYNNIKNNKFEFPNFIAMTFVKL